MTSRGTKKNAIDNPAGGETPLFSRVYVKPMTAEQLYDSLIVATHAHKTGRSGWDQSETQRREWLQQFIRTFGTDDGSEASSFDGTIPQALMMMNGSLVRDAVSVKPGSQLHDLMSGPGQEIKKVQQLYMATLGRMATKTELAALQKLLQTSSDPLTVYQDLFWALLNCNEFILNH